MARRSSRLQPVVRPTEEELKEIEESKKTEENLGLDSNHLTEDANLDFYEKAELNETKSELSQDEMASTIISLRNELESLRDENKTLRDKVETLSKELSKQKSENITVTDDKHTERLMKEVNELRNANHALEVDLKRVSEITVRQQSEIDNFRNSYTRSNYSPNMTVRGNGFITNENGYQEWR